MDWLAILIVILIVAIVWRGPKTIPQIGAMLGRGVRGARTEADRIRANHGAGTGEGQDKPPTA